MFRFITIFMLLICLAGCGGGGGGSDQAAGGILIDQATYIEPSSSVFKVYISKSDNSVVVCGGAVIGENTLLTAGHCMIDATGGWIEDQSTLIPVEGFITHPNYFVSDSGRIFNDISIVYSQLSAKPIPIQLSSSAVPGMNISLQTGDGETFENLNIVELSPTHFITSSGSDSSPCFGDSGSPAVTPTGILGVLSTITDRSCSTSNTIVFTAIDFTEVIQFLESNVPDLQIQ